MTKKRRRDQTYPTPTIREALRLLLRAPFSQPGLLAFPIPQVVQPSAANVSSTRDLHPLHARGVNQKRPFDTDAVRGNAPHRERSVGAATSNTDHRPLEDLHPLSLALDNPYVHLDLIARSQLWDVRILL